MKIYFDSNLSSVSRELKNVATRQIKFAARLALNDVSFESKKTLAKHAQAVFDRPIKMTIDAGYIDKAPIWKDQPYIQSRVFLKDYLPKGLAPGKYLQAQIYGGGREAKRSEKLLRGIGVLGADEFIVPHSDYQNKHGNITKGMIQKILSDMRAYQFSGSVEQNRPISFATGSKNTIVKPRFFVLDKVSTPGIYERKGRQLKLVLAFVKNVTYRKRYYFFEQVSKTVQKHFAMRFKIRYAAALSERKKFMRTSYAA